MTLVIIAMMYGGTLLLTSGIENTSLACTFQWIMNGAPGKATDACNPSGGTGGNTGATGPNLTTSTPPGSVIFNGNPFAA